MSRPSRTWTLLGGVVLLVAGIAAGALLAPDATPASIATITPVGSVPVTRMTTADAQPATLVVTSTPTQKIVSPVAGTVTGTSCAPGSEATSGSSLFTVDDTPLTFLSTRRPLWRDLGIGDSGDDVRSLQQELIRLGYQVPGDGKFTRGTLAAVIAVAKHAGNTVAAKWTGMPAAAFLWLPGPTVGIVSCGVALGNRIDTNAPLADLPQGLASARVSPVPTGVFPGPRTVVVGDLKIPVDASGRVTSAADLASLAKSAEYAAYQSGASNTSASAGAFSGGASAPPSLSVQFQLTEPVAVLSVPAAALYDADGTSACVLGDGHPVRVQIAGSQLGQSFVIPPKNTTITKVNVATAHAQACG